MQRQHAFPLWPLTRAACSRIPMLIRHGRATGAIRARPSLGSCCPWCCLMVDPMPSRAAPMALSCRIAQRWRTEGLPCTRGRDQAAKAFPTQPQSTPDTQVCGGDQEKGAGASQASVVQRGRRGESKERARESWNAIGALGDGVKWGPRDVTATRSSKKIMQPLDPTNQHKTTRKHKQNSTSGPLK